MGVQDEELVSNFISCNSQFSCGLEQVDMLLQSLEEQDYQPDPAADEEEQEEANQFLQVCREELDYLSSLVKTELAQIKGLKRDGLKLNSVWITESAVAKLTEKLAQPTLEKVMEAMAAKGESPVELPGLSLRMALPALAALLCIEPARKMVGAAIKEAMSCKGEPEELVAQLMRLGTACIASLWGATVDASPAAFLLALILCISDAHVMKSEDPVTSLKRCNTLTEEESKGRHGTRAGLLEPSSRAMPLECFSRASAVPMEMMAGLAEQEAEAVKLDKRCRALYAIIPSAEQAPLPAKAMDGGDFERGVVYLVCDAVSCVGQALEMRSPFGTKKQEVEGS
eukprot:gene7914-9400_t